MSLLLLLIDVVIAIILVLIGLAVLTRNYRAKSNILYFLLTVFTACWIVTNYISNSFDVSHAVALAANHLVLLFPGLMLVTFLMFVSGLGKNTPKRGVMNTLSGLLVAIYLLSLTPWIVEDISKEQNVYAIDFGPLAALYFWAILINIGLSFYILYTQLRKAQKSDRQRISIILWSFCITIGVNLLTNLALPYLNGSFLLTNIGPLSAAAIAVGSAYAILKHHLFDIRFFVIRAVAYSFTIMLITALYVIPAIWLISHIVNVPLSLMGYIGFTLMGFAIAAIYRYLRRAFDKLSSRIFYRYYYNPQDVLDHLSDLLVHTIDINQLQQGSRQIITKALGLDIVEYWLHGNKQEDISKAVGGLFKQASHTVVVLDEVADHHDLVQQLKARDIALIVRLRTTHGELGYMVLGYKESGESYTLKDKRLLSTIADEIAISMQNALHFEEIQNFNETLQGRVTQATKELSKTNEKLKALDETKDEFITMASHQLRTPLTSVKGYLSMVLEGDAGKLNKNQEKLLQQSYVSAQRMVFLISDLLNLSRLNTGKFVIDATPVDLDEIVVSEIEQLKETAKSRELEILYDKPEACPRLMLDETKIHQVVMNFLDNAIYYTPPGGKIKVELRDTPTVIEYRVKDNGIGVPRSEQHRLFTKFYRADNAKRARPDGTGLGLFMAKKVIAAQGGSIIFESEEGKGSTFGFRFTKVHHAVPTGSKAAPKAINAA